MRPAVMITLAILGLASVALAGNAQSVVDDTLPMAGSYDVVEGARKPIIRNLDQSDVRHIGDLIAPDGGPNCRDRHVQVRDGRIDISWICDAPDGDIHNVGFRVAGTYKRNSMDLVTTMTLWGSPISEPLRYKRREN